MPLSLQRFFLFLALAVPFLLILGRAEADAAMGVTFMAFLYQSWRGKDFSWLRRPWVKLTLVTWLYLILCGFLAMYDVHAGVLRGLTWLRFPGFAAAFAFWLLPLDTDYKYLRRSLIVLLLLVATDTLVQFFTGTSLTGNHPGSYANRLTGPFGDRMVVGIYLTRLVWPAIGLAFAFGMTRTKWQERFVLPVALLGIFGLTILLSGERMAFCLFVLSAILFWLGARNLRQPLFLLGAGIGMAAVMVVLFSPTMHDRFVTTTAPILENFDQSSYGAVFGNGIKAWKLAPVTGVGPKNFIAACLHEGEKLGFKAENAALPAFNCARHPHNIYLEWLSETGVIGLALFLGLIFLWGRQIMANLRATSNPHYYILLGFAAGMVPFLWPLMTSMSFFINWSAILFWWVLGLNMRPSKQTEVVYST